MTLDRRDNASITIIGMVSPRDILVNVCRIIARNMLGRFINFPLKLSVVISSICLHTLLELLKSNNVRERVLATITSSKVHGF